MKPLLLLVDLQRDYLDSPGLEPAAGPVIERAGTLLRGCRQARIPVVHAMTSVSRDDDRRMPHWKREGRWLCEVGTPGHEPPPELRPHDTERVIHKTFFSAFENGELDDALRDADADLLMVAGVHLHGCVRQAVLDAYQRHPVEIWVAADAIASNDPLHSAITWRYLERRAARFLSVAEIEAALGGGGRPAANGNAAAEAAGRCRAAIGGWQAREPGDRADALERLADRLEPRAEELARAMAVSLGKPVRYGAMEATRSAEMLRAVAARARAADVGTSSGSTEVVRRPLGVVALITPWNNPVYIPLGKLAPALAYGNAVVWKPAPAPGEISRELAGMFDRLPVALVEGGREAALATMSEPEIDAVTITGSSTAGFAAQEVCARRRIPLQAELGGNNAAIVWPDADLALAAREIADGAFAQAGQRCTANRRVIAHRDCRDELLELIGRETEALPWGDPRDERTKVGPLVSAEERERVAQLVARAGDDVDLIVPHGSEPPAVEGFDGAWYPPTIALCEEPTREIVQQESFGPVLVVQTASDWDQAIGLLNGVPQGLVAALFSSSSELTERFLREARAGVLKLGRSTADAEVDVPFGGWKGSGIGPPEHGDFDLDFYTRPQAVYR
jgi:acyl-CoA reductase-like NAD-dependent aldehyde dehydrogenase/nicotinamidase-related amidase